LPAKAVAEISRGEGAGVNRFVAVAVAGKVSAVKTEEFLAALRCAADVEAA